MAKKQTEKETVVVKIRKLKVNYELRYDFLKVLSEYIKRFPKEHRSIKKESIIGLDGKPKDDWVRTVSNAKIGEVIAFLIDNKIRFAFENITPDVVQELKNQYLERQRKIAEVIKLKAEQLDVSGEDYSFMKIPPYEYQKKAVKFFEINGGKAILGDQPGVGKTYPAFSYASKHCLKTLVICPSSLKLMWRKEILKFTNEKAFVYKFRPRKKSNITPCSKDESLFHIVNYESVETYIKLEYKHKCSGKIIHPAGGATACEWSQVDLTKKYSKCPVCENTGTVTSRVCGLVGFKDAFGDEIIPEDYGLIIIDECHRIKEMQTSWTKIIHKSFKNIPGKILLSGTVIKNRPIEFFSSLNFVFPEEWKNSHEFGIRYCAGYESGFGWDYSGASNLEELFTRVSPYFLRRLKKDVLSELPDKTYLEIPIELSDSEFKEYKKLEDAVKKVVENGKEIEKDESFLEKVHKLKLFTGKIKLNRVTEMIEDIVATGEKVVVISDYQEVAKGVYEHFKDKAVLHMGTGMSEEEKQSSVDRFQEDPEVKIFSGMVIASGVGLTLTAASKMYIIGFAWSPADMEQIEDRIHRASTTADTIEIITLICQDTIDEDIYDLLREKAYIVTKALDNKEYKKESTTYNESVYKELINKLKQKH